VHLRINHFYHDLWDGLIIRCDSSDAAFVVDSLFILFRRDKRPMGLARFDQKLAILLTLSVAGLVVGCDAGSDRVAPPIEKGAGKTYANERKEAGKQRSEAKRAERAAERGLKNAKGAAPAGSAEPAKSSEPEASPKAGGPG
jgi:hypothetical protein